MIFFIFFYFIFLKERTGCCSIHFFYTDRNQGEKTGPQGLGFFFVTHFG